MARDSDAIAVHGLKELREAMAKLPLALEEKALNSILMAASKPTADTAKALAPEADQVIQVRKDRVEPGRLKNNIRRRSARKSKHDAEVQVYVRSSRYKKVSDTTNAWFWWWVEFGTDKQKAQPYMRPAFASNVHKALKIIQNDSWKKIRTQAKKLNDRSQRAIMSRLGR